jgi:death on curing protein
VTTVQAVGGFSDQRQAPYDPVWLTTAEVIALHEMQLRRFGGPAGIRDLGALDSALGRPINKWQYEGADLAAMAAAYAYGIARNHPFVDGNKRAAFVAMMLFLRKNGVRFAPSQAEATVIILALAAGEVSEAGLIRWINDRWPKA